ncbi:MAG: ATP-binding cassette domain-containing protein [Treponema sp.]|nr:ATP-binding cassette domain-containing protein [Treponema sp.]
MKALITIKNCRIENSRETVVPELDWQMKQGEAWLVIGPNGGGKADFINALAGKLKVVPNAQIKLVDNIIPSSSSKTNVSDNVLTDSSQAFFSSVFGDSVELVSLERAAHLIQEERENDESEYVEGGVDIGRTGRIFIAEALCNKNDGDAKAYSSNNSIKKSLSQLPEDVQHLAEKLESFPEIKLCGIENILDRGLKYMSTGEIRRTLLARALVSQKKLLLLSDPFAGLDSQSRKILLDFFNVIVKNQLKENPGTQYPNVILGMERWNEIPEAITNVIEFTNKAVSFCGTRDDYEKLLQTRKAQNAQNEHEEKQSFTEQFNSLVTETNLRLESKSEKTLLVEMNNVNVGWGDNHVLVDLNWKLYKGEHWLIQGPNGSGKTTFLELITGDNMQVYCNDVRLFGIKRGSGETVWDIKKRLGIVSYRLHVEYRMLGGINLLSVIISGFHDSIGLYTQPSDLEIAAAKKWLALGGFAGREDENFKNLSYGEQRAILILRAAVKNPEILILDEPCHGLDEQYRNKILHLMSLIAKGGTTTMLHVTHDITEKLEDEKHILQFNYGVSPICR